VSLKLIVYAVVIASLAGCAKKPEETLTDSSTIDDASGQSKYLYVSAGACYSGGNTTFTTATSSNLLFRVNTTTGAFEGKMADFNALPANPGDSPAGVVDLDNTNSYVLIENTAGRRIEKVPKAGGDRTVLTSNTTVLSAALRQMKKTPDGGLLISKGSIIEKITANGTRVGAPFMPTNLGATCGTANALMTDMVVLNNGNIIYSNAVTANNRIGMISAGGYLTAANCLAAVSAPVATAFPVAMAYVAASNQLIVAYAGNAVTTNINSVYVYDVNETANTITNATRIYDASLYPATYSYLLYGISAMTYDSVNNALYIATAISTATTVVNYSIEKFSYDAATKVINRLGSVPFYNYGIDTKCISGLAVGN